MLRFVPYGFSARLRWHPPLTCGDISFQILGPLAALPFLGVAMIFPDRAGGGDIKFVASVGFVLGLLPTLWGGILGLSLAIGYAAARACIEKHCAATPTPIGEIAIPLAPFLAIGFAIFYVLEVMT